jgi:aspartate aminotransferase-like enzyme
LQFDTLHFPWGEPFQFDAIRAKLDASPEAKWLWCAHCETSTGVLNDLDGLKELCSEAGINLCVDAISSIGTVPVDLTGVYLASCASGKGLRSYPGISMVFYHHDLAPAPDRLPRYLDLGYYSQQQGVPFTFSSNLLHALHAATKRVDWEKRFAQIADLGGWLRVRLREIGFELVAEDAQSAPAVVTIGLPKEMDSSKIGNAAHENGYLLSFNSEYLRRKNWIQICLMGDCAREKLVSLTNTLHRICFRKRLSGSEEKAVAERTV